MRTVALLTLVALLAAAGSSLMWHNLLGPTPLGPRRPPPPPAFDPETPTMRALLDQRLPEGFRCTGRRDDSYAAVGRATGLDVRPQWGAMIWTLDVTRHDATDMDLGGMRLREALVRLAAPGPKGREQPGLITTGSTVFVTTQRIAAESLRDDDPWLRTVTRVYPVTDLLPSPATTPAAEHQALKSELLAALDARAGVNSARSDSLASVRELGGQLIVTETLTRHRDVAWALDRMRWERGRAYFLRNTGSTALAAVALAAAARVWLRRRRLARALAAGRCVGCGYDLRASPDACPECGLVATAGR